MIDLIKNEQDAEEFITHLFQSRNEYGNIFAEARHELEGKFEKREHVNVWLLCCFVTYWENFWSETSSSKGVGMRKIDWCFNKLKPICIPEEMPKLEEMDVLVKIDSFKRLYKT